MEMESLAQAVPASGNGIPPTFVPPPVSSEGIALFNRIHALRFHDQRPAIAARLPRNATSTASLRQTISAERKHTTGGKRKNGNATSSTTALGFATPGAGWITFR